MHLVEPLAISELEEAHVLPVDTVYDSLLGVSNGRNLEWEKRLRAQKSFVLILDNALDVLFLIHFDDVIIT